VEPSQSPQNPTASAEVAQGATASPAKQPTTVDTVDPEAPPSSPRQKRAASHTHSSNAPSSAEPKEPPTVIPSDPQQASQGQPRASEPTTAPTAPPLHDHPQGKADSPAPVSRQVAQESTVGHRQPVDPTTTQVALPPPPSPTASPVPLPLPTVPGMSPLVGPDLAALGSYQPSLVSADSAPLFRQAADDPGLSMSLLPHVAHLSLVSNAGDLSLHVRVRDGNADVNVSGSMAPMFDAKAPEVRTVLATQGLGLSSFATDQHGSQQHSQPRPEPALAETNHHQAMPTRRTPAPTESSPLDEGRIHITA
jgi:hypothetical protein